MNHLGTFGELAAKDHLEALGYRILETNWRHKRWEMDIIARDGDVLAFIEVKTRTSVAFGEPSLFVDRKKQQNLFHAAGAYLKLTGHQGDIRFDIVSVHVKKNRETSIELIKDAFWGYLSP